MRKIFFPEWAKELFILDKYRYKVAYGGRGGGKSVAFSDALTALIYNERIKVMIFREFAKDIQHSVHNEIISSLNKFGLLSLFEVTKNHISLRGCPKKSGFYFTGFALNSESVKGLSGYKIVWIEEANTISRSAWQVLKPSVRENNSEIWLSFNPKNMNDAVYLDFCGANPPADAYIVKVNYYDNPHLPQVLEKTRIEDKATLPTAQYNHIWLGMPYLDNDSMLISPDLVMRAVEGEEHHFNDAPLVMGIDPAREGGDRFAICYRKGRAVLDFMVLPKSNLVDSAGRVGDLLLKHKPKRAFIDVGGLGVGVYDILRSNHFSNVASVNFGGSPLDKIRYFNKRAEMYGNALEWFNDAHQVHIGGNKKMVFDFATEMCIITKKYTQTGALRLTPKDQLVANGHKSPDLADSFALTFAMPVANHELINDNMMGRFSPKFYNQHDKPLI